MMVNYTRMKADRQYRLSYIAYRTSRGLQEAAEPYFPETACTVKDRRRFRRTPYRLPA